MDLEGLTLPEQVAFAVLLKALVTADGQVSREEGMTLTEAARVLGGDVFQRAEAVHLKDEEALVSFLGTVQRQEARDRIYDALLEAARADGIQAPESRVLDLVAERWDIVVVEGHEPD